MLVGDRSKALPCAAGDQRLFLPPNAVAPADPCTISMHTSRVLPGADAVFAQAVPAGTIASRSGSATVAPMPRSTVRREM